jgi:hypothetical protein
MGGKSSTTTQQVQIPPEVMARYRSVNERAETVGGTPFQQYGTSASDFVAPINPTQQAGIQGIGNVQNAALPFYGAGAQMTMGGAQGVGPVSGQDINRYMSPYLGNVVGTTLENLSQEQGIQRQQQIGDSIKAGAFGGDRAGLAAANLARQQGMAYGSTAANLLNQGYGQALGAAQAYQGVEAQNLARQLQAGQQIAGLGTGLTNTQIGAGQALLNAGTAEQQTEQAGKSALFNQFQQERSYPFQVAQFLANIAMGTGALSGSTTTTTQPVPFFSDPRLKENMREIGQTHDGMPLYAFNYKGRPGETQIGLNADEVEQMKPEAVGLAGGYKTVDYDAATRPRGGLDPASSMGGAVVDLEPHEYRENFAAGGAPDFASSLAQLYAQFGSPQGAQPGGGLAGPYGGRASYVPQANLPVGQLKTAGNPPPAPGSMANQAMNAAGGVRDFGKTANELYEMGGKGLGAVRNATRQGPSTAAPAAPSAAAPPAASLPPVEYDPENRMRQARGGLVGYADGGDVEDPMESYGPPQGGLDIPTEMEQPKGLQTPGAPGTDASKLGLGSQLKDAAGLASSLYSAGSAVSSALPAIMAFLPFSDERMKDGMQRVGQLDNGLPVYKYSIGDGPTQIGLSAQEAGGLHPGAAMADDRGILHLDYDRATRAYGGGLDPRAGYAEGGGMSDDEYAIRTIATEASGKSPEEARAIARVIENRRATGRWGDSYRDVVTARNQFEPWNNPGGVNYPMRIGANDPRLAMAREAFATRLEGEDPTGGALHFYAPTAQAQLARTRGDRAAVPSWARDREYTDLGPTRFVRGVDDPRASGLMAYAGQPQRSEASGVINQAAGQPAGLGRAAPAVDAPPPSGGSARRVPPAGANEEPFYKRKDFWIPVLTGLGAMASSPSLYAGSAILQGLGAGAQAYSGLEKQQADIDSTRMATEEARQRVVIGSFFTDKEGRGIVSYIKPNGVRDVMPIVDWLKLPEGERPNLDPASQSKADQYIRENGLQPGRTGAPAAGGPAAGSPAAGGPAKPLTTEKPATEEPSGNYIQLPPNIAEKARQRAETLYRSGESAISRQPGLKIFENQSTLAQEAQNQRPQLASLSSALAGLPRDNSALVSGRAQEVFEPVVAVLNNLARISGVDPIANTVDLSKAEEVKKAATQLVTEAARSSNQASYSAMKELTNAIPTTLNSPEAQERLIAEMYIINQSAIDKDELFRQYARAGEGRDALFAKATPALGADAERDFNDLYRAKQQTEKAQLRRMFREGPPGAINESGRPMSWMELLAKNAATLTPDQVKAVEKQFGRGILRYYGVGR